MTKGGWLRVSLPDRSALAQRAHECDHVDSVRFDLEQPITLDAALNLLGAPLSGVMSETKQPLTRAYCTPIA